MAAITGRYAGLDSATLAARLVRVDALIVSIETGHQSGSRPGFSYSKASYADALQERAELEYAQRLASGSLVSRTYADQSA